MYGSDQRCGLLPNYFEHSVYFDYFYHGPLYPVTTNDSLFKTPIMMTTSAVYEPLELFASISRDKPKSATLQTNRSSTRIFLAARS